MGQLHNTRLHMLDNGHKVIHTYSELGVALTFRASTHKYVYLSRRVAICGMAELQSPGGGELRN